MSTASSILETARDRTTPANADWSMPLPTAVFAGEFSAGKSSVINLFVRRRVLGAEVGARRVPLIRLRHGARSGATVVRDDGTETSYPTFDAALSSGRVTDDAEIRVEGYFPDLAGLEIVELQVRDQMIVSSGANDIIARARVMVWCTFATQAWKLSERAVVETFPQSVRARSILAVTRSDLLRTDEDREKVMARLRREASLHFPDIVFVKAHPDFLALAEDDEVWRESNGAQFAEAVLTHLLGEDGREREAAEPRGEARPRRGGLKSVEQPATSAPAKPARPAGSESLRREAAKFWKLPRPTAANDRTSREPPAPDIVRAPAAEAVRPPAPEKLVPVAAAPEADADAAEPLLLGPEARVMPAADKPLEFVTETEDAGTEDAETGDDWTEDDWTQDNWTQDTWPRGARTKGARTDIEDAEIADAELADIGIVEAGIIDTRVGDEITPDDAITAWDEEETPAATPAEPVAAVQPRPAVRGTPVERVRRAVGDGALENFRQISGFAGVCLIDADADRTLGSERTAELDCERLALADGNVVLAYRRARNAVGAEDGSDEILYTLGNHVHLIRSLPGMPSILACVYLSRSEGNLAITRILLRQLSEEMRG